MVRQDGVRWDGVGWDGVKPHPGRKVRRPFARVLGGLFGILLSFAVSGASAQAIIETDLHDFGSGSDGLKPIAGVCIDAAGNIYGTASSGGANKAGMIWKFTAAGKYTDLHDFGSGTDGGDPLGGVSRDAGGNLYGTTYSGGANGDGMVWKLTPSGMYRDLHDFGASANAGAFPQDGVTIDSAGNLYGTTWAGGDEGGGIVWKLTPAGTYTDLRDFGDDADGAWRSSAGVTVDPSGNLYGTTLYGSQNTTFDIDAGTVWQLTPLGAFSELWQFGGTATDGAVPVAGVTLDTAGNLYGTTGAGGANGVGMVWRLSASGTYSDLHDFGATTTDGANPNGGVTLDSAGNMYGTTFYGGANGKGMVWKLTPSGMYVDLWDFGGGSDGYGPQSGVTLDAAGNLYGTTYEGGASGEGMAWKLSAPKGTYISSLSSDRGSSNPGIAGGVGKSLKITVNLKNDTGVKVDLTTNSGGVAIKGLNSDNGTVSGGAYDVTKSGDTSCTFSVTPTSDVSSAATIMLSGKVEGASGSVPFTFTIQPFVQSVQLAATSVKSDGMLGAYVDVYETPATDQTLAISASAGTTAFATQTVTVPAAGVNGKAQSKSFDVTCELVDADTSATLSATYSKRSSASAPFTISGPRMTSVTFSPASNITAGTNVTVTAVLDCPKKTQQTFNLEVDSKNHKNVQKPIAVTFNAGSSTSQGTTWIPTVVGSLTFSGTSNGQTGTGTVAIAIPKATLTVSNNIGAYGGITAVEGDWFYAHLLFATSVDVSVQLSSTLSASLPTVTYAGPGTRPSYWLTPPTVVTGIPVGTIKSGTLTVTPIDIDGNVLPAISTQPIAISSLVRSVTPAIQTVKGGTTVTAAINLYESYPSKQTTKPLPNVPITITSSDPSAYFLDSSGKPQSQTTVTFANPSASASFKIYTSPLKAGSSNKTPTITVVNPWGYGNQTIQLTITP